MLDRWHDIASKHLRGLNLLLLVVSALLAVLVLLGGYSASPTGDERVKVTASIFPLADIAENLGGDLVGVTVLIPPGASPHVFEPTPEAFRRFSETRLFIMVGAGLEFWAEKLITATASADLAVIRAVEGIELIQLNGQHQTHQQGHRIDSLGGQPAQGNPHVWLDPLVVKSLAGRITEALIRLDPGHAEAYRQRLRAYERRLDRLDRTIGEQVARFRIKEYVSFHPAWSYFARRYGLNEVGVIQESPGRDPTPKHIESIVKAIRGYGIKAVFAEPQLNPSAASAIASEAGVKVLILDPLGGPDLPDRGSYIGLMEYNLQMMQEAMR